MQENVEKEKEEEVMREKEEEASIVKEPRINWLQIVDSLTRELHELKEELELKENELNFLNSDRNRILKSQNSLEADWIQMLGDCIEL